MNVPIDREGSLAFHKVGEGVVLVGGLAFAEIGGLVKADLDVAGQLGKLAQDVVHALRRTHRAVHERVGNERASVDVGVVRLAVAVEREGVEGDAGRLAANVAVDGGGAVLLARERVHERLGTGLQAKLVAVTVRKRLPVDRR